MWCIALCHDGKNASAARAAQFQAHAAHNIANIGSSLLTGVLASADDVTAIESDPRLSGSLYCLDVEDLVAARQMMETDPFFTAGAWERIDYYQWPNPLGAWLDEAARPKGLSPAFRCYVAASRAPLAVEGALMGGSVTPLGSTAAAPGPFAAVALLRAASMEDAKAAAGGPDFLAAVPIAIGRWVKISSAEDIASLRR